MILTLADIVSQEIAARLCNELPRADASATPLRPGDDKAVPTKAGGLLVDSLLADPLFRLGVQPRAFTLPILRRYEVGTHGDPTFDDAIDYTGPPIRSDVAVSAFLNDPSEYDGGELIVNAGNGDEVFKGKLGACVIYPSAALRRVEPVTRGARWTAELRVQSLVRGQAERQILYDIGCAGYFIETFAGGNAADAASLRSCRERLLRLWAEL